MPECKACHIDKSVEEFSADRRKTNGCQSYCKLCAAEKVADARKRNPAPHREAMARYGSFYFNGLPCSELVCEDSCWCLPALAGL